MNSNDDNNSSAPRLVIGTRGSDLALVQATATENILAAMFPDLQLVRNVIKTTGDRRTDVALSDVAKVEGIFDKGVFIKELEQALDSGDIDIAVHSLKDLPTTLDPRFSLAAVLTRAPVRDILVSRSPTSLTDLPASSRVGTSSVRRARQLEWLRPDLTIIGLRGNVPTRLRTLAEDATYDAILLAEAGLVRLDFLPEQPQGDSEPGAGMPGLYGRRLPEDEFYPAAGQGAIGLEIRAGDAPSRVFAESICHRPTWCRISAEREFLRLLDAGCHTPVGVYSSLCGNDLQLSARVFPESGGPPRIARVSGPADDAISLALTLYQSLT
ncbi:MAG: hydroxymethylbilane synthase [Akkermansiaceae bacterium]|nr:hydroxymethylbilane synthase [Akkermansiaceae bacterium]